MVKYIIAYDGRSEIGKNVFVRTTLERFKNETIQWWVGQYGNNIFRMFLQKEMNIDTMGKFYIIDHNNEDLNDLGRITSQIKPEWFLIYFVIDTENIISPTPQEYFGTGIFVHKTAQGKDEAVVGYSRESMLDQYYYNNREPPVFTKENFISVKLPFFYLRNGNIIYAGDLSNIEPRTTLYSPIPLRLTRPFHIYCNRANLINEFGKAGEELANMCDTENAKLLDQYSDILSEFSVSVHPSAPPPSPGSSQAPTTSPSLSHPPTQQPTSTETTKTLEESLKIFQNPTLTSLFEVSQKQPSPPSAPVSSTAKPTDAPIIGVSPVNYLIYVDRIEILDTLSKSNGLQVNVGVEDYSKQLYSHNTGLKQYEQNIKLASTTWNGYRFDNILVLNLGDINTLNASYLRIAKPYSFYHSYQIKFKDLLSLVGSVGHIKKLDVIIDSIRAHLYVAVFDLINLTTTIPDWVREHQKNTRFLKMNIINFEYLPVKSQPSVKLYIHAENKTNPNFDFATPLYRSSNNNFIIGEVVYVIADDAAELLYTATDPMRISIGSEGPHLGKSFPMLVRDLIGAERKVMQIPLKVLNVATGNLNIEVTDIFKTQSVPAPSTQIPTSVPAPSTQIPTSVPAPSTQIPTNAPLAPTTFQQQPVVSTAPVQPYTFPTSPQSGYSVLTSYQLDRYIQQAVVYIKGISDFNSSLKNTQDYQFYIKAGLILNGSKRGKKADFPYQETRTILVKLNNSSLAWNEALNLLIEEDCRSIFFDLILVSKKNVAYNIASLRTDIVILENIYQSGKTRPEDLLSYTLTDLPDELFGNAVRWVSGKLELGVFYQDSLFAKPPTSIQWLSENTDKFLIINADVLSLKMTPIQSNQWAYISAHYLRLGDDRFSQIVYGPFQLQGDIPPFNGRRLLYFVLYRQVGALEFRIYKTKEATYSRRRVDSMILPGDELLGRSYSFTAPELEGLTRSQYPMDITLTSISAPQAIGTLSVKFLNDGYTAASSTQPSGTQTKTITPPSMPQPQSTVSVPSQILQPQSTVPAQSQTPQTQFPAPSQVPQTQFPTPSQMPQSQPQVVTPSKTSQIPSVPAPGLGVKEAYEAIQRLLTELTTESTAATKDTRFYQDLISYLNTLENQLKTRSLDPGAKISIFDNSYYSPYNTIFKDAVERLMIHPDQGSLLNSIILEILRHCKFRYLNGKTAIDIIDSTIEEIERVYLKTDKRGELVNDLESLKGDIKTWRDKFPFKNPQIDLSIDLGSVKNQLETLLMTEYAEKLEHAKNDFARALMKIMETFLTKEASPSVTSTQVPPSQSIPVSQPPIVQQPIAKKIGLYLGNGIKPNIIDLLSGKLNKKPIVRVQSLDTKSFNEHEFIFFVFKSDEYGNTEDPTEKALYDSKKKEFPDQLFPLNITYNKDESKINVTKLFEFNTRHIYLILSENGNLIDCVSNEINLEKFNYFMDH